MLFRTSPPRPAVLVVDDDPDVRGTFGMLFDHEGYDVATAVDGAEALAQIADRQFDLILLDLNMPRLDGPVFCRSYRERGGRAPIIVITAAEVAPEDVARFGADDYIAKPFDVNVVFEAVARHLPPR